MIGSFLQRLICFGQVKRALLYFDFQIFVGFDQGFFGSFCLGDVLERFNRAHNISFGVADKCGGETQPSPPFAQFGKEIRRFISAVNQI